MERRECFKLSLENMEWLDQNYERLKKEYDGKWIAVLNGKVVEASPDLNTLKSSIQKYDHPECIVVEYMHAEPIAMFF